MSRSLLAGCFAAALVLQAALSLPAVAQIPAGVPVQSKEVEIVESSVGVLNEIMAVPTKSIPQSLLANAHGIVIVPNMIKGGFVVGVRHGRGVVVVRDQQGNWQPPSFVTMTGGSVGFQAGVQASDVILVFKTPKSVQGLMSGKFTIGADAAAAAGPVGRQAAAATDAQLNAEIFSYSRSRGLFAGVAVDGSAVQIDNNANAVYYQTAAQQNPGVNPPPLPPSAIKLLETIVHYTTPQATVVADANGQPVAAGNGVSQSEALRQQLVASSQHLYVLLDDNWKRYLALPPELFAANPQIDVQNLNAAIARFDQVAQNPRYQILAQRPEFQATFNLMKQLVNAQTAPAAGLTLPPPPGAGAATAAPGNGGRLPRY